MGTCGMAKPIWTDAQIIDQLDTGYHWSGTNLTYAFPTNANWLPSSSPEKGSFTALSAEQRAAATSALAAWDSLIAPNFTLTTNAATANLKFGNSPEAGYAYAYYPSDYYVTGGSVWFNPEYDESYGLERSRNPDGRRLGLRVVHSRDWPRARAGSPRGIQRRRSHVCE